MEREKSTVEFAKGVYAKGAKLTKKAMEQLEKDFDRIPGIEKWAVDIPSLLAKFGEFIISIYLSTGLIQENRGSRAKVLVKENWLKKIEMISKNFRNLYVRCR
jgi:hypothetical protein